jgi:hypothetical protein
MVQQAELPRPADDLGIVRGAVGADGSDQKVEARRSQRMGALIESLLRKLLGRRSKGSFAGNKLRWTLFCRTVISRTAFSRRNRNRSLGQLLRIGLGSLMSRRHT